MKRTIVVLATAIILTHSGAIYGQNAFDPALKKLMPKDQLEFVEKVESLNEQNSKLLFRIRDAKQRAEENERLGTEVTRLQEALVKKLKTEGLKGWVGQCGVILPDTFVVFDRFQPFHLELQMPEKKKAKGSIEEAIISIKIDDVVRFSTKPDPSHAMPAREFKNHHQITQEIKLASITSIEKVPYTPTPPAAKPQPANRKKGGSN
jgi:hypothetical protein